MDDVKLGYEDVSLVPEVITTVCSRSESNPYDEDGYLMIFASCMHSVVSLENIKDFNAAHIRAVLPRSYSLETRLKFLRENVGGPNFVAFSKNEAKDVFVDNMRFHPTSLSTDHPLRICIDLADGHMECLLEIVKDIKALYGQRIIIMTGNVANPQTYRYYEEAGVDLVRASIGTGSVCSTASNTGVYYPPFSLIKEMYEIKKEIGGKCKIVADGGIKGFRDIQKALVYADYVMIGGLFNKAMESAGKTTYGTFYWNIRGKKIPRPLKTLLYYGREVPKNKYEKVYKLIKANKLTVWKENFGMSTKIAQGLINDANGIETKKLKTSEGLLKYQKVEYTLAGWAENEAAFLSSAMSYSDARNLDEFKETKWVRVHRVAYNN